MQTVNNDEICNGVPDHHLPENDITTFSSRVQVYSNLFPILKRGLSEIRLF
jgi:hypothetical protein